MKLVMKLKKDFKFRRKENMTEIIFVCPYCEENQKIEIEGMTEHDFQEEVCCKCKKKFAYFIAFSVDGYTDKIEPQDSNRRKRNETIKSV